MGRLPDLFYINKRNRVEALRTDLRVGLTFARIASKAADGSAIQVRNRANAHKANNSVLRLSKRLDLEKAEMEELADGLERLKAALEALGE